MRFSSSLAAQLSRENQPLGSCSLLDSTRPAIEVIARTMLTEWCLPTSFTIHLGSAPFGSTTPSKYTCVEPSSSGRNSHSVYDDARTWPGAGAPTCVASDGRQ